uniref:DDE Tnp4 domain-containing protein n=1 Tax=Amphimedon queenslandica TaxID=400682 RepID=A0A1X7SJI0_AMPQE
MKFSIKFSSGDALKEVVEGFHSHWGFPNCAGATDGSHIPMAASVDYHSDYYNRKGWYSMFVQAVADRLPGSVHEARVSANSPIYMKGIDGKLFSNITRKVDKRDVPIVVLGDSAYSLLSWLMKPFPHTTLSEEQRYIYCLSRARIVIENAFRRLQSRWRCLMKKRKVKPDNIAIKIMAGCVLHNICEIHGEEFDNVAKWE